jgi:hypothetical protein
LGQDKQDSRIGTVPKQTLRGIEAMNMISKGQVKGIEQGRSVSQASFINEIFGVAA